MLRLDNTALILLADHNDLRAALHPQDISVRNMFACLRENGSILVNADSYRLRFTRLPLYCMACDDVPLSLPWGHYDTSDLLSATYPRPVAVFGPQDAMGETLSETAFRAVLPSIFESKRVQVAPPDGTLIWTNL